MSSELCFSSVELQYTAPTITLSPNFRCPVCAGKPEALLKQTWNCTLSRSLEINTLKTFTMPCCQTSVTLYIAVHKAKNSAEIMCCIQKSSEEGADVIPSDWWSR